jgi:hypothetical protein
MQLVDLQLLPMPRYAEGVRRRQSAMRNDSALIMEKRGGGSGAYIRHAKQVWGHKKKVVLVGWPGGHLRFTSSRLKSPA